MSLVRSFSVEFWNRSLIKCFEEGRGNAFLKWRHLKQWRKQEEESKGLLGESLLLVFVFCFIKMDKT
jgi:hypothetical protein